MIVCPPERLEQARKAVAAADVDAALITPGADLRYLTGYAATALERLTCLVVPAAADPVIVVPRLERAAALASPIRSLGIDVRAWDETDDPYAVVAAIVAGGASRSTPAIAVDDHMWAVTTLRLCAAIGTTEPQLAGPILRELRIRKSAEEVAALRRAGEAIDRVHQRVPEWLRPGRT
jgi:Xaa-Pro aminopeptidase